MSYLDTFVIDNLHSKRHHVNGCGAVGQALRKRKPAGKRRGKASVYRKRVP